MMEESQYKQLLPALEAIPNEEVRIPALPVGIFLQEAHDLQMYIRNDHKLLLKAGLDAKTIEELPISTGALRYAQSVWKKEQDKKEEAEREWLEKSPEAYALKNSLETSYRFAFRRRPDLLSKVQAIEEGYGHADMIQDLSDLAVLGRSNTNLLRAIGMDMKELELAESQITSLANLLGMVNGDKFEESRNKEMRDRAYTYLKRIVDEVRMTGKYVFRHDSEKVLGFASEYYRRTRN